ncbi:MAG TPA: TadE family protein [Symbiobacteriaceae bacterium]
MGAILRRLAGKQTGAATVEAAVILPILVLLMFGGFLCGYYLYVKMALTWHVSQNVAVWSIAPPVEAAIRDVAGAFTDDPPKGLSKERYQGLTLNIPLPEYGFTASVACYKMPFRIPQVHIGGGDPPPTVSDPSSEDLLDQVHRLVEQVQYYADKGQELGDKAGAVVDNVRLASDMAGALFSGRPQSRAQALRLLSGWVAESGMEYACSRDGSWVVTARAVAWNERTKGLR